MHLRSISAVLRRLQARPALPPIATELVWFGAVILKRASEPAVDRGEKLAVTCEFATLPNAVWAAGADLSISFGRVIISKGFGG